MLLKQCQETPSTDDADDSYFIIPAANAGWCAATEIANVAANNLSLIRSKLVDHLLNQVSRNSRRLLYVLLPLTRDTYYELRVRKHNYTLPIHSSALMAS